jgi:hypothetical protein
MNTAGIEWMARVAARNRIEVAKALTRSCGFFAQNPLSASASRKFVSRVPHVSPEAELAATIRRQKEVL